MTTGVLGIYRHLPGTNCRDCGLPSCMAFANALTKEERKPDACPHLPDNERALIKKMLSKHSPSEGFRETIDALKVEVQDIDLQAIASDLGATYDNGRLSINCLGKDFILLDSGQMESVCHVNVWVEMMLLNYCKLQGKGRFGERWVTYGELPSASPTAPYFERRCEEPLRAIADAHTQIFLDLMEIFGGKKVSGFNFEHAFTIYPLPKVPFLVLYTGPEGEFESNLKILLDSEATTFVPKETLINIGRGIVEMFKKIVAKHRDCTDELMFM